MTFVSDVSFSKDSFKHFFIDGYHLQQKLARIRRKLFLNFRLHAKFIGLRACVLITGPRNNVKGTCTPPPPSSPSL